MRKHWYEANFSHNLTGGVKMGMELRDFENLSSTGRLSKIVTFSTHPAPGLFFSDPFEGETIFIDQQKQLISLTPSEIEGEKDVIDLIAIANSERDLVDAIGGWITQRDHEVSFAVSQHFLENIQAGNDWWQSLPHFFWTESSVEFVETLKLVDQYLLASSALYTELAGILSGKKPHAFSEYEIDYINGFSKVYQRLKL